MVNFLIILLAMAAATTLYMEGRERGRRDELDRQSRQKRNLGRLMK